MKTLYSVTAKGVINTWKTWAEGPEVVCQWGKIDGAQQTSRYTALPKNTGRANATTAEEQAVKEVEALIVKQLKKKYSETLETAGQTARFKPMLAGEYAKHKNKITYPVTVQPKLDGVRCIAYRVDGRVVLQSRGGEFYHHPHIQNALEHYLEESDILDGELYIHGVSLQTIASLARKPQPESLNLEYRVYDVPSVDGPWLERGHHLQQYAETSLIHVVDSLLAYSAEDVAKAHASFVEQGFEGAMVRTHSGLYRQGYRSPDLLKLKSWTDDEFKIVGHKTGKGKFENVVIFKCLAHNGKEFDVAPKGTAKERAKMLAEAPELVGKYLKVKYFDLTDEGKPHFPVGLAIRYQDDM